MIAISCELLEQYFAYQKGEISKYNKEEIANLLKYIMPLTIGKYQKERLNLSDELVKMYADGSIMKFRNYNKEDNLIKNTELKIMLTNNKNEYPYINVNDDIIKTKYSGTFYKEDNRNKAEKHIKVLLENANNIFIYDNHISKPNVFIGFKDFFNELVPRKQLNIYFPQNRQFTQQQKVELLNIYNQWEFKIDRQFQRYYNSHDRYLIIDNKIELIFTSGIEYLFDDGKDFTYIINVKE